jgi:hypothetical protein
MKVNKRNILKINRIFAVVILLLFSLFLNINAQVSFAPKIGLSYSKLSGDLTNARYMPGAFFGGIVNYKASGKYSFQSGVLLTGKGSTLYYDEDDSDAIVITYFEIPLNNQLTAEVGSGIMQFFAGPYLAFAINGMYRYLADEDDLKERIRIGTSPDDEIKPMDIGINLGIGFLFEGLETQLGYGRSISNISNRANEKLGNNLIYVSIAYFFNYESRPNQYKWYGR